MYCYERANARKFNDDGRSPSGEIGYVVFEAADELAVEYAVLLESPATAFNGLTRRRVSAELVGGVLWHATAEYSLVEREEGQDGGGEQNGDSPPAETPAPPEDAEPLGAEWSWSTTGGSVHITQSKETRSSVSSQGGGPPDYNRAIGVSKDGVEGCDVFVPKFEWTLTREFDFVTRKYLRVLAELTGTVNQYPFMGWQAQEVLFLGADGGGGNKKRASIAYKFSAQKTQQPVDVGGGLAIPLKRGWDYIWVAYGPTTDANFLIQRPIHAYCERVYDTADFSKLGLGI